MSIDIETRKRESHRQVGLKVNLGPLRFTLGDEQPVLTHYDEETTVRRDGQKTASIELRTGTNQVPDINPGVQDSIQIASVHEGVVENQPLASRLILNDVSTAGNEATVIHQLTGNAAQKSDQGTYIAQTSPSTTEASVGFNPIIPAVLYHAAQSKLKRFNARIAPGSIIVHQSADGNVIGNVQYGKEGSLTIEQGENGSRKATVENMNVSTPLGTGWDFELGVRSQIDIT